MRPQAMANTHHPSAGPLPPPVVWSLRCRPPEERFDPAMLPAVDDVIGIRLAEGGDVVPGVVTDVASMTEPHPGYHDGHPGEPDPNVWRVVVDPRTRHPAPRTDGHPGYRYELIEDPWPQLTVRIDPQPGEKRPRIFTVTREERLPPHGGWVRDRKGT